ncbi:NADH:ubiquinone reductase (Na(+)-transporting) subunit C [Rapidithrix thailandica]|uniref:Na(+)-translocating NADH-quinone reductase subunit C n=1 Tax=Rapidithrix thailandica TaxID=413964 RepID=A0AAW9S1C8_9BACT
MQQSNGYIIGFAAALTVILGAILSFAAVKLKPIQKREIELDTKKQILSAVMSTEGKPKTELEKIYNSRIQALVVNYDGEELTPEQYEKEKPEDINLTAQYKKKPEERFLPVFKFMKENSDTEVEFYILPMYGYGLWNYIWGYVAVKPDLNTIAGVSMDHVGETPGLGARITDPEVLARYKDKKIYDPSGKLVSVEMLKGEGNKDLGEHEVDGMSGATLTAKGVNKMLETYFEGYSGFFKTVK